MLVVDAGVLDVVSPVIAMGLTVGCVKVVSKELIHQSRQSQTFAVYVGHI